MRFDQEEAKAVGEMMQTPVGFGIISGMLAAVVAWFVLPITGIPDPWHAGIAVAAGAVVGLHQWRREVALQHGPPP